MPGWRYEWVAALPRDVKAVLVDMLIKEQEQLKQEQLKQEQQKQA